MIHISLNFDVTYSIFHSIFKTNFPRKFCIFLVFNNLLSNYRIEMMVRAALVVQLVAQIGAKVLAAISTEEAKNSLEGSDAGALTLTGTYNYLLMYISYRPDSRSFEKLILQYFACKKFEILIFLPFRDDS